MKLTVPVVFFFSLLTCLPVSGCKASEGVLQQKYGADAAYFEALRCLKNEDESSALRYFTDAAKNGSPVIQRKALEQRARIENVSDRIKTLEAVYKKFPDKKSLENLCREYYKYRHNVQLFQLTKNIEPSDENAAVYYYKLMSLTHQRVNVDDMVYDWCTRYEFTDYQRDFLDEFPSENPVLLLRKYVYEKKYSRAFAFAEEAVRTCALPLVYSDAGKAFIYGSGNYSKNALIMETHAESLSAETSFYAYFYAGRLYSKAGNTRRAMENFAGAMKNALDGYRYDNALWYYLNESLKGPVEETLAMIEAYSTLWTDPVYFDDLFETVSTNLLTGQLWKEYVDFTAAIDGKASDETCAKFSYVSGRLIQLGYASGSRKDAETFFKKAAGSSTSLYYILMGCSQLGFNSEDLNRTLRKFGSRREFIRNRDLEYLLEGYADYGFPEYIYEEWQKDPLGISMDCSEKIALFLRQCGSSDEKYYPQSLRIAARKLNSPEKEISRTLMELSFPRDYSDDVRKCCEDFNQSEYLLYALIRSESFFDSSIQSSAGATGLTQLMDGTAGDVARKLKLKEYNLTDSSTNIRFGSFYLEEMIHRIEGSEIRALFSYNAGITNVRKWIKTAAIIFNDQNFSNDLFLEALPFAETREYGRKLVSAASLYGELYYGKTFTEVIRQIMN